MGPLTYNNTATAQRAVELGIPIAIKTNRPVPHGKIKAFLMFFSVGFFATIHISSWS